MPTDNERASYCNPCQSYHPVSQPCFSAATVPRRIAPVSEPQPQSQAYRDAATVEAKLGSIKSAHYRALELMNWKLASIPSSADETALVDEVQRRIDQVVEAAVEWHQAGREGGEWFEAAERLGAAIDSLLELRCEPESAEMPRRWCAVHNREEFKYESLEHELHAADSVGEKQKYNGRL